MEMGGSGPDPNSMFHQLTVCWVCLIFVTSGCTYNAAMVDDAGIDYRPIFEPFRLTIGVYYSPEFAERIVHQKARRHRDDPPGFWDTFVFDVGESSVKLFNQVSASMFWEIDQVTAPPPQLIPNKDFDAILAPEFVSLRVHTKGGLRQRTTVVAKYEIPLLSPNGAKIDSWLVSGTGVKPHGPTLTRGKYASHAARAAIRAAFAKFLIQFRESQKVREWLNDKEPRPLTKSIFAAEHSPDSASNDQKPEDYDSIKVGVLWWPASPLMSMHSFAQEIEQCLVRNLAKKAPKIAIAEHENIQSMLFPLMEPNTQPQTEDEFARLIRSDNVRDRLAEQGVDYLIAYSGNAKTNDPEGGIFCGGGYQAAGCLGFSWRNEKTALNGVLWDLRGGSEPYRAQASDSGTSLMPALLVPILIPANTEAGACRELSKLIIDRIIIIRDRPPER